MSEVTELSPPRTWGQVEWLEYFAWRDARARAATAAWHEAVALKLKRESDSRLKVVGRPVVLDEACEIDSPFEGAPTTAQAAARRALECGWKVRVVRTRAAHPDKGIVEVYTVRCRRGGAALWAAWWNGTYEHGWAWPTEPLAGSRLSTRVKLATTAATKKGVALILPTGRGLLDAIEER